MLPSVESRSSESRVALSLRMEVSMGVGGTTIAVLSGARGLPVISAATGSGKRAISWGQNAPPATATAPSTDSIAIRRRRRLDSSSTAAARARAAFGRGGGAGGSGVGGAGGAMSGTPGGVGNTVSPTGMSAPT